MAWANPGGLNFSGLFGGSSTSTNTSTTNTTSSAPTSTKGGSMTGWANPGGIQITLPSFTGGTTTTTPTTTTTTTTTPTETPKEINDTTGAVSTGDQTRTTTLEPNDILDNPGSMDGIYAAVTGREANEGSNSKNSELVARQEAIAEGAQEAQQNAEKIAAQSAAAGINKSRAGMLSDSSVNSTQNVANNYIANKSQTASTQADYLNKMNQANALDQQAKFMNKSSGLTALGAGIQGAAAGATMGAMVSDERLKEDPDGELKNAIKQFRSLYKRLKELKCTE